MALPTKINNQYGFAYIEENGGKGSGNFGHSGRPGQVGGSGDGIGSSKIADEIKSIIDSETERLLRRDPSTGARQKSEKIAKKLGLGENGANYIHSIAVYKAELKEAEEYLKRPRKSPAQEEYYKKKIPEIKGYITMYEKVLREAIKKTQIHQKYLDQGLSNIQEKTVAKQEKKIKALRKIKTEYRDSISKLGKQELAVMSRLDKQEKDAVEYLEKLKEFESSKKKTNGVKMKKELYNELKKRIDALEIILNGGKGSGNFGHSGRPGMVGGSGDGGTHYGSKSDTELKSIEKDVLSRIQKLEKAKEHVADHHRYGSKEYDAEKEDIQYELDSLNDQHEEVKAEIKKREQSSKGGEAEDVSPKIKKLEKALTDYANGDDIISIMTHKDEWEKFEKWAKKERYTKDEWEKLLASLEFGEYARDIADM